MIIIVVIIMIQFPAVSLHCCNLGDSAEVFMFVNAGSKQVLNCKVFVGLGSCQKDRVEIVSPYWLLNGSFVENNPYLSFVEQ